MRELMIPSRQFVAHCLDNRDSPTAEIPNVLGLAAKLKHHAMNQSRQGSLRQAMHVEIVLVILHLLVAIRVPLRTLRTLKALLPSSPRSYAPNPMHNTIPV
ncbi:hypothetical protein IQ07DRAFT_637235 [Pyrenochaeta sp. DS3sAY3a]|nr:hypothetical protein IQ07DRAFT_637235 [Pyrenochaeta sp. DS3sAY3a]